MPYSQFTLEDIQLEFEITIKEEVGLFSEVPEVKYSDFLAETLKYNTPLALAIATEKAKSEAIILPILIELKKQLQNQISVFSGKEFNINPDKGLTGFCDFLITRSPSQLSIEAPVTVLVEAKNDNLNSGLGQCMAEMIAAQMFNQTKGKDIATIYGCVTTGSLWQFMRLTDKEIEVDLDEYFLKNVGKILGILRSFVD
ncbi:MAG: hypothetical protein F6K14_21685 [Symploca sp. SIO2C1]|nr:hypothetical protein [Symploca sp. SIO2C1]